MLLQSDYPPDIRVSKEIGSLRKRATIWLLCNNKSGQPEEEVHREVHIVRLRYHRWLGRKLNQLLNLPLFFNPVWVVKALSIIRTCQIDFLHVHDLPLMPLGIFLGRLFHVPVIYDMHENYPEALRIWIKEGNFANVIFKNPWVAAILDKICVRMASRIIVVTEEHKDYLVRNYRVDADKIFVVANTVDYEEYLSYPIKEEIVKRYQRFFVLTYLGKFSPERGLEVPIRAMGRITKQIPHAKLLLVGDGPIRAQLLRLAVREGVSEKVEFTGWVDFKETLSYLKASDVCIVPQPSNPLIDNGIPHKFFQYLAAGKPVIVSDAKAFARIVKEYNCGKVFRSDSVQGFAQAVIDIYRDHDKVNYGRNGQKAVFEKYNWAISSKMLINVYDSVKILKSCE